MFIQIWSDLTSPRSSSFDRLSADTCKPASANDWESCLSRGFSCAYDRVAQLPGRFDDGLLKRGVSFKRAGRLQEGADAGVDVSLAPSGNKVRYLFSECDDWQVFALCDNKLEQQIRKRFLYLSQCPENWWWGFDESMNHFYVKWSKSCYHGAILRKLICLGFINTNLF